MFGVLQNLGRYSRVLPSGINIINPITEKVVNCSRQTQMLDIVQPVITKDNVSCQIVSIIYYRITDPIKMIYKLGQNQSAHSVREMAFAAVRTISGENTFDTLVGNRAAIGRQLKEYTNSQIAEWGIFIEQLFIKGSRIENQICYWTGKLHSSCRARHRPAGIRRRR